MGKKIYGALRRFWNDTRDNVREAADIVNENYLDIGGRTARNRFDSIYYPQDEEEFERNMMAGGSQDLNNDMVNINNNPNYPYMDRDNDILSENTFQTDGNGPSRHSSSESHHINLNIVNPLHLVRRLGGGGQRRVGKNDGGDIELTTPNTEQHTDGVRERGYTVDANTSTKGRGRSDTATRNAGPQPTNTTSNPRHRSRHKLKLKKKRNHTY